MTALAHNRVYKIAREIALTQYEKFAHDNAFYKAYPTPQSFLAKWLPKFLPEARKILVQMLKSDKYTQEQKDEIAESLIMDRTLPGPNKNMRVQNMGKRVLH
jgi:hypothetical protein